MAPGLRLRWDAAVSALAAAGPADFCKINESDEFDGATAGVLFTSFAGSPIARKKELLEHKRETDRIIILTCGYADIIIYKIQGAIPPYERKMPQERAIYLVPIRTIIINIYFTGRNASSRKNTKH
jgi:H2-forming N5,N10-methylenetetrahydromethanopterin dehydrogenase-like enzyme